MKTIAHKCACIPRRYFVILFITLSCWAWQCKTPPSLHGEYLVKAKPSKLEQIQNSAWDPRIDTNHVYALQIVRCTKCEDNLALRQFTPREECPAMPCTELKLNFTLNQELANENRKNLYAVATHYLRFIDDKRVIYGVHKDGKLPDMLDLEDRFRKRPGGKRFARGYYYWANGMLFIRFQDRKNHKIFDWALKMDPAGKSLNLHSVTAYNAQDQDIFSNDFAKNYTITSILSFNFTFYLIPDQTIPFKPACKPCLGQPPETCKTW